MQRPLHRRHLSICRGYSRESAHHLALLLSAGQSSLDSAAAYKGADTTMLQCRGGFGMPAISMLAHRQHTAWSCHDSTVKSIPELAVSKDLAVCRPWVRRGTQAQVKAVPSAWPGTSMQMLYGKARSTAHIKSECHQPTLLHLQRKLESSSTEYCRSGTMAADLYSDVSFQRA